MSSTRRTPVHSDPVFSLSGVVAAAVAAVEAAAAAAAAEAEAEAVGVAAFGAAPAVSARRLCPLRVCRVLLSPAQAAEDIGAAAVCRGAPVVTARSVPAAASQVDVGSGRGCSTARPAPSLLSARACPTVRSEMAEHAAPFYPAGPRARQHAAYRAEVPIILPTNTCRERRCEGNVVPDDKCESGSIRRRGIHIALYDTEPSAGHGGKCIILKAADAS